jgi:Ala-tRNA(Pro) deacylase
MGIALSLQEYLNDHHINYEVMTHERTGSSLQTARASHVPSDCLAKGVILIREGGYVLAVVPACSKVRLDVIEQILHCPVDLASEVEVNSLFPTAKPVRCRRSAPRTPCIRSLTTASISSATSISRAAIIVV